VNTRTRLLAVAASAAALSLAGAGAATADGDDFTLSPSANGGTTATWSGAEGNGNVTFFDQGNQFQGTAQFPGEGPVGYRGTLGS